ncbi:MAG TPA: 16S rRNA (guanine(527)-N(7))-methyltransferase RsmG [Solirubrobacteraceae bacterium]|nr:16S rRNA (guanine(527)-N(7))-methyltransferase RsmG [Solirubrobacteraceae bacterium]
MRAPEEDLVRLSERFGLPPTAVPRLDALLTLLTEDPLAPTTLRDRPRAVRDHLADALVALDLDVIRSAATIADLGAGAGVPGLPLAIARPEATVYLVESNHRKCAFIERAAGAAGAVNAIAVPARAEDWREGLNRCDVVTARALAALPVVAEYAAPLLRDGGALVAWRGQIDPAEEAAGRRAAAELGLRYRPPVAVRPHRGAEHRHLQVMVKTQPTPPRFPRRAGMARKRPLGSPAGTGV